MATLASIISADLGNAADDFYITFSWGSNTIKGYISTVETNNDLDIGGFKPEYRANLFIQKSQFTGDGVADPTTGSELTVATSYDAKLVGLKFRIGEVTISDNATFEFELESLSE
jgi:hypothetical protein